MRHRSLFFALALLLAAAPAYAQDAVFKTVTKGTPKVESIDAINFGPGGVLLIADSKAKQVLVVDTPDSAPVKWSAKKIENIGEQIAGRLGTVAKSIEIQKMAVNPVSLRAYFAVRNLGDNKKSVLLSVDGSGKISEVGLENVKYARIDLAKSADRPVVKITDITWAGDRILVAVQASDATFASKIISIPTPVQHEGAGVSFSTETYHVAHRRWETKAPIRTIMPYREKGQTYLIGAFTCTPIVKYRVDDLQPGAKVKGQSVIEVGYGNDPLTMFTYEKDDRKYILMNTYRKPFAQKKQPVGPSNYWTVKVDYDLLSEIDNINEKALVRVDKNYKNVTDRAQVVESYHGVAHMDRLDAERAIVVRVIGNRMDLEILPLP